MQVSNGGPVLTRYQVDDTKGDACILRASCTYDTVGIIRHPQWKQKYVIHEDAAHVFAHLLAAAMKSGE